MAQVTGIRGLIVAFEVRRKKHLEALARGLYAAGLYLQAQSQEIVPVDKGVLRDSAFTRLEGTDKRPRVNVGYTVAYGIFVHENLDAAHGAAFNAKYADAIKAGREHSRGENQQAKFLERPFRENRDKMREIVKLEFKA